MRTILTLLLIGLVPARVYPDNLPQRRLSPSVRHRKGKSAPKKSAGILSPGRWRPEVRAVLDTLMRAEGKGSKVYSEEEPPVAVLSWDGVAAYNNAGEAFFQEFVDKVGFKFGREFWARIPVPYGEERIRAGYGGFINEPRAVWPDSPYYAMYRKAFFGCYQAICREQGRRACSSWLAVLLAGFDEGEIRKLAAANVARSLKEKVEDKSAADFPEDPSPVKMLAGLRKIPEMEDLVRKLKAKGFDVWVMGVSNQWSLEEFAKLYGLEPDRVVGVRVKVAQGRLTGEIQEPVPYGPGRAEAVVALIGRSPVLVVAGAEDEALLDYGRGVRVVVGPPSGREREKGWLVQPAFNLVK